ncbi:solute carrier family 23 member 2-like [Anneissia japonica]|uniref:solute carrier family 23 member 2-like n=1 Tax=Anneissia japonica TaxID=1529436 RepID=UPI0014258F79|nr:solute carrier family 23 member 2-like [Anneissia japonica]
MEFKETDVDAGDGTQTGNTGEITGKIKAKVIMENMKGDLTYGIQDVPPISTCIFLGFQQYLTMFGATLAIPLLLSAVFCMDHDLVALSELIGTIFFVSGLATLLQTTFGCRLPIVQGGTFVFVAPTFAILGLQGDCPAPPLENATQADVDDSTEVWQSRIRESHSPLYVFNYTCFFCSTIGLIVLFSQYLKELNIPFPSYSRNKGIHAVWFPGFKLFPVILGIMISWILSIIITATGGFPDDPNIYGYNARTDSRIGVLEQSKWFRFPYPGQWGLPSVTVAGVFGMLAGVLASMVESIGDYYACARLSGAPPPPTHAINRGIGIEGIGCIIAGLWGSGNGTTSYSENIGAIGITKVGSVRVVQVGGFIMILLGCFGKFGALFVTIPDPIVGGLFCVMFGMVTAVGLSNLQFVDLNSSRNLFVVGFSLIMGLVIPNWLNENPTAIQTGISEIDQIITVLLSTSMFVGGILGFLLDNTIPGTDEERGLLKWREVYGKKNVDQDVVNEIYNCYDLPWGMDYIRKCKFLKYVPISPTFTGFARQRYSSVRSTESSRRRKEKNGDSNQGNPQGIDMASV